MSKLKNSFVTALDIGDSKVVCFVANVSLEGEINIIGVGHQLSQGIKSGVITDIKLAEDSIRSAVGTAEQIAGVNVDRVIVNISGSKQESHHIKAELQLNGQEVSARDISRLISKGCEQYNKEGREIVHCVPIEYSIDGTPGIIRPEGMYGQTLSATLNVITASSSSILNLTSCLASCHLNVEGYISSAYASGIGCLSDDEKELGVTLLDFGGGNVSIAAFKNGSIVYANTISLGGMHITKDIAIGLYTNIETSERIKALYGNVLRVSKDEQEIIDIPQICEDGSTEISHIQKSMLISIIRPRVEETLEMVKAKLKKAGLDNVGGYIVITGGASQLGGLSEMVGQMFNKQVRIGMPKKIEGTAESTKGAAFATCAGILMLTAKQRSNKYFNFDNRSLVFNGLLGKVVIWLRNNF